MTAMPERKPVQQGHSTAQSAPLVAALMSQAETRAELLVRDQKITAARARLARECRYTWLTPAGQIAEFRVYFLADGDLEILAAELLQLDDGSPTATQRLQCESQFEAELAAEGDVWAEVESYLWEQVQELA